MKKNIFFICLMLFAQKTCTNNGLLGKAIYYERQEGIKNNIFTQDRVRFSRLEDTIREKYKNINIPEIIIAESIDLVLTGQPLEIGCCYFCEANYIMLRTDTICSFNAKEIEWMILHEAGHAQRRQQNGLIESAIVAVPILVAYYWGAHRTKPYKNTTTKLLSKAFAATFAGIIIGSELIKAEEKHADRWANEHADEAALLGGIDALNRCKAIIKDKLSDHTKDSAIFSKIPFSILEWMCCPYHPSIDSRISNIEHTLKERSQSRR